MSHRIFATLLVAGGLCGCQVVSFDPPPAGTSDDDDAAEPAADPIYHCDPTDLNACGTNQKCTVLEVAGVQNVYDCVDDDGNLETYSACTPAPTTGQDNCPKGTVCVLESANQAMGFCMPMCDPNQECDGVCSLSPELDLPLCGDACNPLEPNCPVVLECHPNEGNFGCQFKGDDHSGGVGDPCDPATLSGCAESFYCAQGGLLLDCDTQSCCTPACDTQAATDTCESPYECTPVPGAPPEASNLGICIVPA